MKDLIAKIASLTGMREDEIIDMIGQKQEEFSGMISGEGAAYIVAKELGVSLLREEKIKIKDLKPGMRGVELVASVRGIHEREYSTEKGTGMVCSVYLVDDTGSIRLTLWNHEIDALADIQKGDSVRVVGYVKKDHVDEPELRLGPKSRIEKLAGTLPFGGTKRCSIAELHEDPSEVRAAMVSVFESNLFYEVCPECNSRIRKENNFLCDEHGAVTPSYALVLSGILDDGTANIRAVFFGSAAETLLGMSAQDAWRLFVVEKSMKPLFKNVQLGMDFLFEGRLRTNKLFNRPEFIVNGVKSIDVKKEIATMIGE